jgi:ankyrin repeat protein
MLFDTLTSVQVDIHPLWLRRAAAQGCLDIVKFLVKKGVDAKDLGESLSGLFRPHDTRLLQTIQGRELSREKLLRRCWLRRYTMYMITVCRFSPLCRITNKTVDVSKKTALHYASEAGNLDIVNFLIQKQADVRATGMSRSKF